MLQVSRKKMKISSHHHFFISFLQTCAVLRLVDASSAVGRAQGQGSSADLPACAVSLRFDQYCEASKMCDRVVRPGRARRWLAA